MNNWPSPRRFAPSYAIIAGGRPDQAVQLEQAGVPTYLHVPSAKSHPHLPSGGRTPLHIRRS